MKKLLTIIVFIFIPFFVSGQESKQKNPLPLAIYNDNVKLPLTAKERSQIIEVYGDSAEEIVFSNPHRLKSIKHILRNRVVIKMITNDDNKKPCPKLSEVTIFNGYVANLERDKTFNLNNFNPLKYNFEFYSRAAAMYQVDNTNYYIIIKSQYQ